MLLDLVAGQVLALAAHHTAVFVGVTQFAFVQHEEVVRRLLSLHPVGKRGAGRDLHRQRAHRQRADRFTQGGQQVFGLLRTGRVDQDQTALGIDRGEGAGLADEGTRKEGLDDLVLDLVALLLVDLAHLLGLDFVDLLLHCILDHAAGQDTFFLACGDQQKALAGVHQRGVFTLAERRDETIGAQFLAGAGAGGFGGQCSFESLGI